MSFFSKIWVALRKLGHLVGCKMVVVTSIVKRATLGKQTNDCGNRSNTRIKSNSDHPIIWERIFSELAKSHHLSFWRNSERTIFLEHQKEAIISILWLQAAVGPLTQLNLTSTFGLCNLIALCSRANQVRQDKLIIFFLISSRVNFTGQSIPVEENLQCGLERGLSWGDTLLHCHACYKYNAATMLQMLQFYNTGRPRLHCMHTALLHW